MDLWSVVAGALIGAAGTITAALVGRRHQKEEKRFPDDIIHIATGLSGLRGERLKALRKYTKGRHLDGQSDEDKIRCAVYRTMAIEKLVNVIETDSGGVVVTLTDLGWSVATALDSLKLKT
jgi:hypothetical protein